MREGKENMKKVLYVTTVSRTINAFLIPHINMLLDNGYEIHCACSIDKPVDKELQRRGVKIFEVPFSRNPLGIGNIKAFIKLEELTDYNNDYQIFKWFPNCFAFGGDLGGNHFCYNFITNEYFAVDCCTGGLEDSYCKAVSLYKFIKNWDKQFEEENNYEI